jgi:hypothetical protein
VEIESIQSQFEGELPSRIELCTKSGKRLAVFVFADNPNQDLIKAAASRVSMSRIEAARQEPAGRPLAEVLGTLPPS